MTTEPTRRDEPDRARQREAEDLFDRVRLLPESDRPAAIDAGTRDPWVRAEVRSLLRFDVQTLTRSADTAAPAPEPGGDFDARSCIGLSVGGFTLRSVIGIGGMGTVFEAEQELPARRIAVKVLHAATVRASALARFRKESEFLAKLDHQNIARIISAGTLHLPGDGSARPYFAMELVDGGRTITRWARESRADRRSTVAMLATACDAVGSGHRAGVAHLDLKPGNLLVSSTGTLRVIDYGIARSLDEASGEGDAPFAGTPQYMSPEQCTRGARVDSRADVYALGLILYELVCGRLPYETRGQPLALAAQTVRAANPPAPRLVDSTIPADLEAIVVKALAKNPDARYGTASELADDLRRWLRNEPVIAGDQRMLGSLLRLMRRNPIATTAVGVAVAAVVAGAVVSVLFAVRTARTAESMRVSAARAHMQAAGAALDKGDPAMVARHLVQVDVDQRGWEFRGTASRMNAHELYSRAESEVLSVSSVDATGEVIAGVTGGTIVIADRAGARPPECFDVTAFYSTADTGSLISVSPSRDGKVVFANTTEATLFALDRETATATRLASGSLSARVCGPLLASANIDGSASLHDPADGRVTARCGGAARASDSSLTADGRTALFALDDGTLRLIDIDPDAGTVRERWRTTPSAAHAATKSRAAAIAPDGSTVVAVWSDDRITRHDLATGREQLSRDLPGGSVYDLAISPDGRTAAASSWSNQVRVIDVETLGITRRLGGTVSHVWGIEFTADGTRLVGRISPGTADPVGGLIAHDCVGAWILADPDAMRDMSASSPLVAACAGPRPGCFTAVAADGTILELDARSGSERVIGASQPAARRIAAGDGVVVLGDDGGSVRCLRVADGRSSEAWRVRILDGGIQDVSISPDGGTVVAGDADHSVAALDTANGARRWKAEIPLRGLNPSRRGVQRAVFLDGGEWVTFTTQLTAIRCPTYRVLDGAIDGSRFGGGGLECDDAIERGGVVYGLGITGFITIGDDAIDQNVVPFALNGGVITTDRARTRIFTATRDAAVRVGAFDPVTELARLDSPPGKPLAIAFDEERDELTVVTVRGILRTWRGSTGKDERTPALDTVPTAPVKRTVTVRAPSGGSR